MRNTHVVSSGSIHLGVQTYGIVAIWCGKFQQHEQKLKRRKKLDGSHMQVISKKYNCTNLQDKSYCMDHYTQRIKCPTIFVYKEHVCKLDQQQCKSYNYDSPTNSSKLLGIIIHANKSS